MGKTSLTGEQMEYSLARYGFPLITPELIDRQPIVGLERLVINILRHPADARHVEGIPIVLIEGNYDVEKLVQYAREAGQQNRLGYLAELAWMKLSSLPTGQTSVFRVETLRLQQLVDRLYNLRHDLWQPLVSTMKPWYIECVKLESQRDPLRAKWAVYTRYTPEEANKHFRAYVRI